MSAPVHSVHTGPGPSREAAAAGGAGLRAFHRISELWHLSVSAQLPRDTLERLSYLLGIYKALQLLLPDTQAADEWIRRPNDAPLFGGKSALDRMLSGNVADLFTVRQYLDAQRG